MSRSGAARKLVFGGPAFALRSTPKATALNFFNEEKPPSGRRSPPFGLARNGEFIETNQSDLGSPVPFAKIFRFTRRANHLYKFAPSHPTRGAYHDRHGRGVGCGGRGSVLRAMGLQGG
jgi:hypothetical protein